MTKIYFSRVGNPEEWPDAKSITIRPSWMLSFVVWVLRKLGFTVHDYRRKK